MEFKDFRARWGSIQLIFATIPKDYPTFGSAYKGTRNHFWWEGLRNLLIFGSVEKFSGRLEGGPESFFGGRSTPFGTFGSTYRLGF